MRYLYKPGDRVVSRKLQRAGKVAFIADAISVQGGYRVVFDGDGKEGNIKFVLEDDLYPESPTYEQAKRELSRSLEAIITHEKAHLLLLEESIKWAKKMWELMPENEPSVKDGE